MRANRWARAIVAVVLTGWVTAAIAAQSGVEIAGAGAAPFPNGTTFNLVTLEGLQLGAGATAAPDASGSGDIHVTLVGRSALGVRQDIVYDAKVTGVSASEGTATLVGTGTLDMADGTVPVSGVPVTLTVTGNTVLLFLGTTTLPEATLTQGAITIK